MNVLFVIYSLAHGGAERVTTSLANHWSRKGWTVTIVTLAGEALDFYALHSSVRRIPLQLTSEGGNPLTGVVNNVRRISALRKILKQVRPDVAVGMMDTANVLLALAARGTKAMATIGSERTYPPRMAPDSIWGYLRRWTYGQLAAVAAQTDETKVWIQSNTRARHVVTIPNATEWPLPTQAPVVMPEQFVGSGQHVLLTVGRLETVKGFDQLIDAFSKLSGKFPDWHLVILGEGSQRGQLQQQISERGMSGVILMPGVAGNVADWYRCADLYVLSSRFEGFPNTLVEALAHGLPVVSFDCHAGPRDIIREGIDGLLVPAGDVSRLSSALNQLMVDETMRRSLAGRAVEARERFSLERIAGMWEALFSEVRHGGR